MSKLFSSIVFSFFLLFQTTSIADEETTPTEINTTEETESTEENDTQTEVIQEEEAEEEEPKEVLSEAEKEAIAAEEAELREAGMDEEPLVE
ncbi:MAG: hypothetical protein WBM70_00575 [Sulfurovum sp.]|uniref:hypothetical protein n=1 Tax=Sulfurovum sp. TaxID=1969726 RepID=UPI003C79369A